MKKRPPVSISREGGTEIIRIGFTPPLTVIARPAERVLYGYGDPVRVGDRVNIYHHGPGRQWRSLETRNALLTYLGTPDAPGFDYLGEGPAHAHFAGKGWRREFEVVAPRPEWWIDLEAGETVMLSRVSSGHRPELRKRLGQVAVVLGQERWREADKYCIRFRDHHRPFCVSCRYLSLVQDEEAEAPERSA